MPNDRMRASRRGRMRSSAEREQYYEARRAERAQEDEFYAALRGQQPMNASPTASSQGSVDSWADSDYSNRYRHNRATELKRRDSLIRTQTDYMRRTQGKHGQMTKHELKVYDRRVRRLERAIDRSDKYVGELNEKLGMHDDPRIRRAERLKSEIKNLTEKQARLSKEEESLRAAYEYGSSGAAVDADREAEFNARLTRIQNKQKKTAKLLESRKVEYAKAAKKAYKPGLQRTIGYQVRNGMQDAWLTVRIGVRETVAKWHNSFRNGTRLGQALNKADQFRDRVNDGISATFSRLVINPVRNVRNSINRFFSSLGSRISKAYHSSLIGHVTDAIGRGLVKIGTKLKFIPHGLSKMINRGGAIRRALRAPARLLQKATNGLIDGIMRVFIRPVARWTMIGLLVLSIAATSSSLAIFQAPNRTVEPVDSDSTVQGVVVDPESYQSQDGYTYFAYDTQPLMMDFMVNHNLPYKKDGSLVTLSTADVATIAFAFIDYKKFETLTGYNYIDEIDKMFTNDDTGESRITDIMRLYLKQADYSYTYLHRDWNAWEPRISGVDGNDDSVLVDSSWDGALVKSDPDTTANGNHREWTREEIIGRYNADEVDTYTKEETRTISTYTEGSIDLSFADSIEENTAEETYTTTEQQCTYDNDGWVVDSSHPSGYYNKDLVHQTCEDVEVEHTRTRYDYTYTVTVTLWKYRTFNSQWFDSNLDGAEYDRNTVVNKDYSYAAKKSGDEKGVAERKDAFENGLASKGMLCVYPASSAASSVEYGGYTYDSVGEIQGDLVEAHDVGADEYTPSYSSTPTIVKRRKLWTVYSFEQMCKLMTEDWDLYNDPSIDPLVKHYDIYGVDQNEDSHLDQIYVDYRDKGASENGVPNQILYYSQTETNDQRDAVVGDLEVIHEVLDEMVQNYLGELIFSNVELMDDAGYDGTYNGTLIGADVGSDGSIDLNEAQWAELNAYAKANGIYFTAGSPARDNWCTNFTHYIAYQLYGVITHGNGGVVVKNLCNDASTKNKFVYSTTPAPGAIFSITRTTSAIGKECGHTGIVTSVNLEEGWMTISDANYNSKGDIEYNRRVNLSEYYPGKIEYAVPVQ